MRRSRPDLGCSAIGWMEDAKMLRNKPTFLNSVLVRGRVTCRLSTCQGTDSDSSIHSPICSLHRPRIEGFGQRVVSNEISTVDIV
jgi:hypothetical protein